MDGERWNRVKDIVNACLEIEQDKRTEYIAEASEGDAEIRAEAESLLASHSEAGDFLESPVEVSSAAVLVGRTLGAYEIREIIGEGGMGTVCRAVRTSDYEKQVAIKLVKLGMDTASGVQRFRHERQILAALDHPNIARLLDGGATPDGQPYFVMEFVKGAPITEYAEERRLGTTQRLELFRTVCAAVQYAHQNLVIHRDLKPSNILVTETGVPKLLDFGIAKLLEQETGATETVARLMTPECASPEQVRGEPITTGSDVYSLGVLLYRLLTGEGPYHFSTRTPAEIERLICETDPKPPSRIRPLGEDLDNIALKAMHKEPARRYVSAEQFSEDVRRYLEGLPVIARKDTFTYRASRFVSRNKAGVAGALLVALSLVAGLGAALWEAHLAKLQSVRAERRFNDVRKLANSLLFEIHDAVQNLPGSTPVRKLIVDRALTYLDSLGHEAAGDKALQGVRFRYRFYLSRMR